MLCGLSPNPYNDRKSKSKRRNPSILALVFLSALAVLHTNNKDAIPAAEAKFLGAISMSDHQVEAGKLIYKTIR